MYSPYEQSFSILKRNIFQMINQATGDTCGKIQSEGFVVKQAEEGADSLKTRTALEIDK